MDTVKYKGTVVWFNARKGYGFLAPDEPDEKDVFIHWTGIDMQGYKQLQAGDIVEYALKDSPKGIIATDIVIIKSEKPENPQAEK
jgi:CspA family cold shock protein